MNEFSKCSIFRRQRSAPFPCGECGIPLAVMPLFTISWMKGNLARHWQLPSYIKLRVIKPGWEIPGNPWKIGIDLKVIYEWYG